jgi:uncharacterized protein with PIN domain
VAERDGQRFAFDSLRWLARWLDRLQGHDLLRFHLRCKNVTHTHTAYGRAGPADQLESRCALRWLARWLDRLQGHDLLRFHLRCKNVTHSTDDADSDIVG